jgi:hypothetical protein
MIGQRLALPSGEQLLSLFNALATQLASKRTIESNSEIPNSANSADPDVGEPRK